MGELHDGVPTKHRGLRALGGRDAIVLKTILSAPLEKAFRFLISILGSQALEGASRPEQGWRSDPRLACRLALHF